MQVALKVTKVNTELIVKLEVVNTTCHGLQIWNAPGKELKLASIARTRDSPVLDCFSCKPHFSLGLVPNGAIGLKADDFIKQGHNGSSWWDASSLLVVLVTGFGELIDPVAHARYEIRQIR